MAAATYDFHTQLAVGNSPTTRDLFDAAYRVFFPDVSHVERFDHDMALQKVGRDGCVVSSNGVQRWFDEKTQEELYSGLLLEILGNVATGAPGWMEKALEVDYIVYGLPKAKTVYLIPYPALKAGYEEHKDAWYAAAMANRDKRFFQLSPADFRWVVTRNRGFNTHSIVVPRAEFDRVGIRVYRIRLDENAPIHE